MEDLTQLLLNKLAQISDWQQRTLVLGYSGGVDSEVLAFGLSLLKQRLPAIKIKLVYVHHGLSINADNWSRHCQSRAEKYQLPFVVKHVTVNQAARTSLEAEARKVRYRAFFEEMQDGDILLTAHHQDDQFETLLLALKRGQGPKGLSAMAPLQPVKKTKWQLRPLLDVPRADIEAYAADNQLSHIEDESNQDTRFDRNFLRQQVIPLLKQRWPSITKTASRTAQLCADQQLLLEEVVSERLKPFIVTTAFADHVFDLSDLAELSHTWQRQLFRGFIEKLSLPVPSKIQLDEVLSQLLNAKQDATVELKVSGLVIRRFKQHVYVCANDDNTLVSCNTLELSGFHETIEQKGEYIFTHNACKSFLFSNCEQESQFQSISQAIKRPKPTDVVTIRFTVAGGSLCHPHFRNKRRSVKKLMQELNIPPWERKRIPFLFYGEELIAALGFWVERSACVSMEQAGIVINQP
ncbi:MAG: tRNA lysidine(34) synthetase TilS [Parashewanella sp.]